VQHRNIFGNGVRGDGEPMILKKPENPKIPGKKVKFVPGPTQGMINLTQKVNRHKQSLMQQEQKFLEDQDAAVYAGEKTKAIADIEKIDHKI